MIPTPRLPKRNLYLIEEPTIGLHMADVKRLFDILHRLVDEGHTVVVIEHHPEVFAEGGHLVPQGTPGLLSLRRYQTEDWQILIF